MPNLIGDKKSPRDLSSRVYLHLPHRWEPTHRLSTPQEAAEQPGSGKQRPRGCPNWKYLRQAHLILNYRSITVHLLRSTEVLCWYEYSRNKHTTVMFIQLLILKQQLHQVLKCLAFKTIFLTCTGNPPGDLSRSPSQIIKNTTVCGWWNQSCCLIIKVDFNHP